MQSHTIERVPNFRNMFAESAAHPSHEYRIRTNVGSGKPIPDHSYVKSGRHESSIIRGSERPFYFAQPVLSFPEKEEDEHKNLELDYQESENQEIQPQQIEDGGQLIPGSNSKFMNEPHAIENYNVSEDQSQHRIAEEMGVQTLYRESEAQTDPFSPEYTLGRDVDPETNEVLKLSHLKWNDGLPGGQEQIAELDHIRHIKDLKRQIPRGDDPESFKKREEILLRIEKEKLKERERKDKINQDERIKQLDQTLSWQEKTREFRSKRRIDNAMRQRSARTAKIQKKLEKRKNATMRKLYKKHKNTLESTILDPPTGKLKKRDVIEEYDQPDSETYAPRTRNGRLRDMQSIGFEVRPILLEDTNFDTREFYPIPSKFKSEPKSRSKSISKPKSEPKPKTSKERKEEKTRRNVEFAYENIERKKNPPEKLNLTEIYKASPKVVRPPTPTLDHLKRDEDEEEEKEEEKTEESVILLQSLLRGRAIQNEYYEGKERSLILISELQAVEEVKQKEREEENMKKKEKEEKEKENQARKQSALDGLIGEVISRTLDYLSKELVRDQEVQNIRKMMSEAKETRRKREAEEMGRRQKEEQKRSRIDEYYQQVSRVNQEQAEYYVDDIMAQTVEEYSHKEAMKETREYAEDRTQRSSEQTEVEQVRDLVSQFLLPQVDREMVKRKVDIEQQKYLKAAHDALNQNDLNLKDE